MKMVMDKGFSLEALMSQQSLQTKKSTGDDRRWKTH